ncbi:MAG: hypothetical protein CG444_199 [Methanosaeta sp. ASP1-2]|nr:MAG: hypothetical protein CG444_199 [Methanosaeta sp. ASP1-2]
MNSKAFAIFVGVLMVLSAFAGFMMMGSNQNETIVVASNSDSLQTFGVQGRLVEWDFEGLSDVLEMSPESTVMACWINMSASQNLTDAARAAIPQSIGLSYPGQLYGTTIEKLAKVDFNGTWTEYHWIRPYPVGYNSLVIPYQDYMMIPVEDYVTVLGKPVLFGPQDSVRSVIDVISGGLPAEGFTLVGDEQADFAFAALGSGGMGMPLSGGYKEFYLSAKAGENQSFDLRARYLQPQAGVSALAEQVATKNNLSLSRQGSNIEISGAVARENLQSVLTALLGP